MTPGQRRAWQEDGWCVVPGVLSPGELAAARPALARLFPTAAEMDAAAAGAEAGDGAGAEAAGDERTVRFRQWDAAWPELPFRSRTLNAIALHEGLLDLAEDLLGTHVRLYMALVTAKYAGQDSGFNRLLHVDYPNHSLVVPRDEPGYRQLELFVYLDDVTTENGATHFVSRRRTAGIPVGRHTLSLEDHADLYDELGQAPGQPGQGSGAAVGPAGSVVAYRPDVYHRSVDWTEPGRTRTMFHLGYRPAGAEWAGYQSWPFKGLRPEWYALVPRCTPRQLVALGFPPPGHPYWTDATLGGVADRYPGLDLGPWRPG